MPFVVDALSYAVSFVTLLFVRPTFQDERPRSQARLLAEVAEGVVWLWRRSFLRVIVALIGASNFAFNALPLVMIVRARQGPEGVIALSYAAASRSSTDSRAYETLRPRGRLRKRQSPNR